jgi:glycosyltransferase involved in cell wall biosynthesis
MKLALVHDYLCGIGGSERIFQYLCEEFNDADIYTLAYNKDATLPFFRNLKINTTWLNFFVRSMETFRWSFPIATHVMETIDFKSYDVVLSSSATVAKYIRAPKGAHICYCYIPTRALWQKNNYFKSGIKSFLISLFLRFLKKRDLAASRRVDKFIAISKFTQSKISETYSKDSIVIPCPIDLDKFYSNLIRGDYFLLVSRLENWKCVDYAIEAFNILGLPLRIIGTGIEQARLKSLAKSNIVFMGSVDDAALSAEYSKARAVIFTPFLEYGLVPLEANASGAPVICFGKGGIEETMIPWAEGASNATAVFFFEQNSQSLINAVRQFQGITFNSERLVNHASAWGIPAFKQKIRKVVQSQYENLR